MVFKRLQCVLFSFQFWQEPTYRKRKQDLTFHIVRIIHLLCKDLTFTNTPNKNSSFNSCSFALLLPKRVMKHYVNVLAADGSTWRCEFIFSDPVYCWCRFVLGGGDRNYTRNPTGNRNAGSNTRRTKKVNGTSYCRNNHGYLNPKNLIVIQSYWWNNFHGPTFLKQIDLGDSQPLVGSQTP